MLLSSFFPDRISGIIFHSDIDIKILPLERKVCLHEMVGIKGNTNIYSHSFRFKNLFSPVVYFQIRKKYIGKKEDKRRKKERKKGEVYEVRIDAYHCRVYIDSETGSPRSGW